jgi:hypothetical protein
MNDDEAVAAVRTALAEARDSLGDVRMERPAAALTARARARRLRRGLYGGVAVTAALAIGLLLAGVLPAVGRATGQRGAAQARTVAYVVSRVESALAGEHLVFHGTTTSTSQTSVTWAYGRRSRFEEFSSKACGHVLPDLACTGHGGPVPGLASGTALIGGKLVGAYVTYFNHRYSLSALPGPGPANACSAAALTLGGPPMAGNHWSDFIHATLACGAAKVTGHVRIDGVETTKITGKPITVRLLRGYGKLVHEHSAKAEWIWYVNPKTYLPVRMYGSTQTFGGPGGGTVFASVTDVHWLPPTPGNVAKALVTIPPGFHRWRGNPGGQG